MSSASRDTTLTAHRVTLVVSYVALLVYMVVACWKYSRCHSVKPQSWPTKIWAWISNQTQSPSTPRQRLLLREVMRVRISRARAYSECICHVFFLVTGHTCFTSTYTEKAWSAGSRLHSTILHQVATVAVAILSLIFWVRPQVLTKWVLNLLFVMSTTYEVLHYVDDAAGSDSFQGLKLHVHAMTIVMGVLVSDARVTVPIHIVTQFIAYCLLRWSEDSLSELHHAVIVRQAIIEMGTTISLWVIVEKHIWDTERSKIEAKFVSQSESVVKRILTVVCDAVVVLGSDLCIKSDLLPQSVAMLLRLPTPCDLAGRPFVKFFVDNDQERIAEGMRLLREASCESVASMHTKLAVGGDEECRVQVFFCCFHDVDDQLCYYVGVREDAEQIRTDMLTTTFLLPPSPLRESDEQDILIQDSRRGTPPTPGERNDIGSNMSSETLRKRSKRLAHRMLPEFQATTVSAKELSIFGALTTWNFSPPASTCCPFHSAVAELKCVARRLHNRGCNREWKPMGSWQCDKCGILDDLSEASAPVVFCEMCQLVLDREQPKDRDTDEDECVSEADVLSDFIDEPSHTVKQVLL